MKRVQFVLLALGMLATSLVMNADQWNKKTKVTFSSPVQVPGASLPAGSYIFLLDESASNRHIVRVMDMNQRKTLATILAIPDYRLNAASKTVMYFSERATGAPPALKSWFYPGDNFGHRFVYPKVEAVALAKTVNEPVPMAAAAAAPVMMLTPDDKEVKYEPKAFEATDAQDTQGADGEAVKPEPAAAAPAEAPAKLPKTASPIHVIGGLGALLVAAGALANRAAKRLQ
jgi:hypothetical protein